MKTLENYEHKKNLFEYGLKVLKMAKFDLSLLAFRLGKVLVKYYWLFPKMGLNSWYNLDCHTCIITSIWKWQHYDSQRQQSDSKPHRCDSQPKHDKSKPRDCDSRLRRLRLATTAWWLETTVTTRNHNVTSRNHLVATRDQLVASGLFILVTGPICV